MSYHPFTKEEREQARSVDLAALLTSRGEKVYKSGSENMWLHEGRKVTLRGNLWFDQYEQIGGDAIDFACRFYHTDYPEAVRLLLSTGGGDVRVSANALGCDVFIPPPKHENMRRVYAYLLHRRGIDTEVLEAFVCKKLIYETTHYHNAAFVGVDISGQPRHIHLRGTATQGSFKGNAAGSQPEYSFHWAGTDEQLFLFEAPIDLLSFVSLHKSGWRKHSYAAACSVSDRVLWQCLQDIPNLKKVILCFDSDAPGQAAVKKIAQKLAKKNIEYEILVPQYKDWNEDLLHLRKGGQQWTESQP